MITDETRIDFIESLVKRFGHFMVYKMYLVGNLREYLDSAIVRLDFKIPHQKEFQFDAFI